MIGFTIAVGVLLASASAGPPLSQDETATRASSSTTPTASPSTNVAQAEEAKSPLRDGVFSLALRYRLEHVDDDNEKFDRTGFASTLRTTLGFKTSPWHGLSASIAVEDVTVVGDESYNNIGFGDRANGKVDRPVVADPAGTEVSQAFLAYRPKEGLDLRLGRQEVSLADERLVGPVGWRQNHQEFDAFALDLTTEGSASSGWSLNYAYLDRVHQITGAQRSMSSHALVASWRRESLKVSAYGLMLDYQQRDLWSVNSNTAGLRLEKQWETASGVTTSIDGSVAEQVDGNDNPRDFSLGYGRLAGLVKVSNWTFGGGLELLEGNGEVGFSTPLATLHKFNGTADRFLATPGNGLEDSWVELTHRANSLSASARFHWFRGTHAHDSYGHELDLVLSYSTRWKQTFSAEAAMFEATATGESLGLTGLSKLMLTTSWSL